MKFDKTDVWGFEHAIRGMRNPMKSWDHSDSYYDKNNHYIIGDNDIKLAQRLILAGSEHRKLLRQIFISVDITAPLFWWKEADTYKINVTSNSESTMHKLASTPITIDCFEIDDFHEIGRANSKTWEIIISICEDLRQEYNKTKDKRIWKELIRILPESWLQTRTMTFNYENILNMYYQRKNHKLNEWSGIDDPTKLNFVSWVKTLPYAEELILFKEENNG